MSGFPGDFGLTWALQAIQDAWGPWDGCKVRVSIANADLVWAGCGLEASPTERTLYVSKDSGQSFEPAVFPTITKVPNTIISGLATHPVEAGTAYALFGAPGSPKILETKDYGQTWTDLTPDYSHKCKVDVRRQTYWVRKLLILFWLYGNIVVAFWVRIPNHKYAQGEPHGLQFSWTCVDGALQ